MHTEKPVTLPIVDLIIVVVFMAISIGVGIGLGRKQKNLADFALGGRNLPWWALMGSIVATETSTATFLGVTGRPAFADGDMRFLQLAFGYVLGRIAVSVILLPQYFRGELFTAYEVLNKRFGGATQRAASALFLIARNLGDGLRLFLCAVALRFAVGLPLEACVVIIGIATIVYTVCGGMKSVVWNDCIQLVIYIIGGVAALFVIVNALPQGWDELLAFAKDNDSLRVFVTSPPADKGWFEWIRMDVLSIIPGVIGGAVFSIGSHGVDQMMVQRYLSAKSQRDATKALIGSGVVVLLQFALFLFVGVALHCFIQQVSPPGEAEEVNKIFAWFVVNHMPVGLTGLTMAAVFAAAMSTLSSSLSASATAVVGDFSSSEKASIGRTRIWIVVFGVVQMVTAIVAKRVSEDVVSEALAIHGFVVGALLGVFLLGTYAKQIGERGALIGMVAGVAVVSSVHMLKLAGWVWYPSIGTLVTFVVGVAASKALGENHESVV